jgi:hypothetical protein
VCYDPNEDFRMVATLRNHVNLLHRSQLLAMNTSIKPKLKPAPPAPQEQPPQKRLKAANAVGRVIAKEKEESTSELNHMAVLGGLGLLVHISEIGETVSSIQQTVVGDSSDAVAVDPRDQVDPRKRFLPR